MDIISSTEGNSWTRRKQEKNRHLTCMTQTPQELQIKTQELYILHPTENHIGEFGKKQQLNNETSPM